MNFDNFFQVLSERIDLSPLTDALLSVAPRLGIFALFVLLSLTIGRWTPYLTRPILHRIQAGRVSEIYTQLIEPLEGIFQTVGTLILISWSLTWLRPYESLYNFLKAPLDLAIILAFAWLVSRFFRQLLRSYGIGLLKRFGLEVNELLLVLETIANVLIGIFAILAFAQSRGVNLVTLVASLGIAGAGLSLAAQRIVEQLLSAIVLYLDRPFSPGHYIRMPNGELGRVESIGLRSTKIRASAKNTLFVVPNSTLVNADIENVTLGKKVMVMVYLDFARSLKDYEQSLVQQVAEDSTGKFTGIDPASTRVSIVGGDRGPDSRARISFFIFGSGDSSLQLRKRFLELANQTMTEKLTEFGIEFDVRDPVVYVESPMTL